MPKIILLILVILYAVPISRLAFFFLPPIDSKFLRKINAIIGRYEWLVKPPRDCLVFIALLSFSAVEVYKNRYIPAAESAGIAMLSVFSILRFKLHARKMVKFALEAPLINPKTFFGCYYAGFGIIPLKLPDAINIITPENCSFKKGGSPSKRLLPVVAGVFNTYSLAHLVTSAYKWKGPEFSRKAAACLITVWGARLAQLGHLAVKTTGIEKIKNLEGKVIFAFNHKSYLDFALGPLAIAPLFNLRFLAARDHFLDNPFLYSILGRAMQVAGMIFVDRKRKKDAPSLAASQAADKLANLPISIAIFPQGTRAISNITKDGRRMDSGYYTSGTKERLLRTGGHLKKGTAYIAAEVSLSLKDIERSMVHIVPVGLFGTAVAAPKGSVLIQSETDILVKIGDPITIRGADVSALVAGQPEYKSFVEEIHRTIDERLKGILEIHAWLEQRFFKDIRSLITPSDYENVSVAMKAWRGKDYLIYTLLDCIYATRPGHWPNLLRELCYLMMEDAPAATLANFKGRVIDTMLEGK